MSSPKILIACEFSGRIRDSFLDLGYDAISCDLLPTASPGPHIKGDVSEVLQEPWDLVIAHPSCTYLCNSGVRHLYKDGKKVNGIDGGRINSMVKGANFFRRCLEANSPLIAVENPIMHGHARNSVGRGPDFSVQPWMFGDPHTKRTCFWTVGLPPLVPDYKSKEDFFARTAFTEIYPTTHYTSPGPDRWKKRSITYPGIAHAIAQQWGPLL